MLTRDLDFSRVAGALFWVLISSLLCFGQMDVQNATYKEVLACEMIVKVPRAFERLDSQSVDSCVYKMGDVNTILEMDVGLYNREIRPMRGRVEFKKRKIQIAGYLGELVTFRDVAAKQPYVSVIYLKLRKVRLGESALIESLLLTVSSNNRSGYIAAKQIFQSIRFNQN